MRRRLATSAHEWPQRLTARRRIRRGDVTLGDRQDESRSLFTAKRFQRGPGRTSSVNDHRPDRGARGRFHGPLPTGFDLDEIEKRAEDTLEVTDDGAPTGARKLIESPGQRFGVRLGAGGPVGRRAKFFVARGTLHLGVVGRVLGVQSFLSRTLQIEPRLVEGVSNHFVFGGALREPRVRITETGRGSTLALAQRIQ